MMTTYCPALGTVNEEYTDEEIAEKQAEQERCELADLGAYDFPAVDIVPADPWQLSDDEKLDELRNAVHGEQS